MNAEKTFVSEAQRLSHSKAEGLVTSPAFIVMKAADRFANPTTADQPALAEPTSLTSRSPAGLGSDLTVLTDFSRYIVAWKLCTTMALPGRHRNVELALQPLGALSMPRKRCFERRPRVPLGQQRAILRRQKCVRLARGTGHAAYTRQAVPPDDPGQNRAMASLAPKIRIWLKTTHSCPGTGRCRLCPALQSPPL